MLEIDRHRYRLCLFVPFYSLDRTLFNWHGKRLNYITCTKNFLTYYFSNLWRLNVVVYSICAFRFFNSVFTNALRSHFLSGTSFFGVTMTFHYYFPVHHLMLPNSELESLLWRDTSLRLRWWIVTTPEVIQCYGQT